jgi:hypothetical protein
LRKAANEEKEKAIIATMVGDHLREPGDASAEYSRGSAEGLAFLEENLKTIHKEVEDAEENQLIDLVKIYGW